METTLTQAIISGIFTIIGIWYKNKLDNNSKTINGISTKTYVKPKEQMKKGVKRIILAFFIMVMISIYFQQGEKSTIASIFAIVSLIILFYGIWLIIKGFFRMVFS